MTLSPSRPVILVLGMLAFACQSKERPPSGQPGEAPTARQEWTINTRGYGPIRAGMTMGEAAQAGGRAFGESQMGSIECDYFLFAEDTVRGSAHFMVVNGQIARVDVNDSSIATAEGARMGDTEQRIMELYPGRVTVQPHKYSDGHYLVVAPASPADSGHHIIFETDGQKVTTYRAGRMPEVEYVEGCS